MAPIDRFKVWIIMQHLVHATLHATSLCIVITSIADLNVKGRMSEDVQRSSEVVQESTHTATKEIACNDSVVRQNVECPHKNRRGLFKVANLRKKVKNLKKKVEINYCEDCARLDPPEQRPSSVAHWHGASTFFAVEGKQFRCFSCEKEIGFTEEESSLMKAFLNDYNSFIKPKLNIDQSQSHSMKSGNTRKKSSFVGEVDSKKNGNTNEKYLEESKIKNSERKTLLAVKEDNIELMPNKVLIGDKQVQILHVYLPLDSFDGPLNNIFASFIRDFKAGLAIHPSSLFSEIARKAPRFRGWAQQDAHELLRYLMDGLRMEEINRYKEAISRYIKVARNGNPKLTDGELSLLAKGMLKACGRPLIDAVFGGTLLQTVKCSDCGHLSKTYEDFLDLSLPLPSTSAKTLFNGTYKMHKSTSLSLIRRKSHEIISHSADINHSGERSHFNNHVSDEDVFDDDDVDTKMSMLLDNEEVVEDEPCSLASCLRAFTTTEVLSAPNTYECEKCCVPYNKQLRNGMKKRTVEAEKRYLIYEPPPVLTLHLKRFEQRSQLLVNWEYFHVLIYITTPDFPLLQTHSMNVSHSGDLSSGHYVAFIKNRYPLSQTEKFFYEAANLSLPDSVITCSDSELKEIIEGSCDGEWYYASDLRVSSVSESRVLGAEGYSFNLCMPCCTVVVFDSRLRDCIMNGDYIGPSMIEILMITKICLRRKITLSPYKSFAVALGCDALSSNKLYLRHDSVVHYVSANGSNAIDYVLELQVLRDIKKRIVLMGLHPNVGSS
ncbi:hypothetical protein DINM_006431 [Dirofilaria immitis]|nr:hypothetical protein [Dirofilaria immitis]